MRCPLTVALAAMLGVSLNAQSLKVYKDGVLDARIPFARVDSITYNEPYDLWQEARVQTRFYYAPGWQQIADPSLTLSDGVYTLTLPTATQAQWQAQAFLVTDLATDIDHQYDFSMTFTASKDIPAATVKLYQDGDDGKYYFTERIDLRAGVPYPFQCQAMDGMDMQKVSLVLDFGGNPAGATVQFTAPRLDEHDFREPQPGCSLDDYRLVWYDEFGGSVLNSSRWEYQTAAAGWVNHELQTYVSGRTPSGAKVAEVNNGTLKIHAIKEGDKVYSARIYGRKSTGFKYGYIEARMKLPVGRGTWPAFWMMPSAGGSWPDCGEIDIMEEVGADAGKVSSSIHCKAYNHPLNTQKTHEMYVPTSESRFHVYALEWTPDYIKTYVDGHPQLEFPNDRQGNPDTWPFDKAFYIILNLAWGGDWGGYKGVDESALPATMEVDYVRAYQKK
ncbi:MAG: glycoside hydrolase family 16 protein [Bacteroidaceae bacterium]|nr:glycoside hydrolase family 16 protein [Bacteroidaceae bacterium]